MCDREEAVVDKKVCIQHKRGKEKYLDETAGGNCECSAHEDLCFDITKSSPGQPQGKFYCKSRPLHKRGPKTSTKKERQSIRRSPWRGVSIAILITLIYLINNYKIVKIGGRKRSYRKI